MKRKSSDKIGKAAKYRWLLHILCQTGFLFLGAGTFEGGRGVSILTSFMEVLFVCFDRIFREKQYAERRLKDFDDALTREAVRDIKQDELSCFQEKYEETASHAI